MKCSKCKQEKEPNQFNKHNYCKSCKNEWQIYYYHSKAHYNQYNNLLSRIKYCIKNNTGNSYVWKINGVTSNHKDYGVLGCSFEDFKRWFEFLFNEEMSWENYSKKCVVEHLVSFSHFSSVAEAFNWKNLHPYPKIKNLEKYKNRNPREELLHEIKLRYFLKNLSELRYQ